jgi:hypothetical protein
MALPSPNPPSPNHPGAAPRPRTLPRASQHRAIDGRLFHAARARALTPLEEIRALDAAAFTGLPLPTVLELEVPGHPGPVWLRSAPGRGAAIEAPVIDGPTFQALTVAVASDRARPVDLRLLLDALAQDPSADGAVFVASWMDGVPGSTRPLRIGQVLERLGAKLFSVRVEELSPASSGPAANGPAFEWAG